MSEPLCPSCGSPLDPAHAPIARIVGARVVTFCSTECADSPGGAVAPSARPARPAREPAQRPRGEPAVPAAMRAPAVDVLSPEVVDVDSVRIRPRKQKKLVLGIAGVIVVGGMALAIIQTVSPSSPGTASASDSGRASVGGVEPGEDDAEPSAPESPEELLSLPHLRSVAIAELRRLMKSRSPRVSRVAAMAMARTGDDEALALLHELLPAEESELNQIQLAFALARAGDESGREFLKKSLRSDRRDVRLDSARALVELGDDSGKAELSRLMSLRTHKLGAAGLLARLGEEEGTEILRRETTGRAESEESRLRALVALGRAGDATVAEPLREVLEDARFNVGAADALATLGDEAALPALQKQLGLSALRVRAAEAIVQLGAEADLASLAPALATGDEAARVSAAEAILILSQAEVPE